MHPARSAPPSLAGTSHVMRDLAGFRRPLERADHPNLGLHLKHRLQKDPPRFALGLKAHVGLATRRELKAGTVARCQTLPSWSDKFTCTGRVNLYRNPSVHLLHRQQQ